jgi:hypothetical protein
MKIVRHTTTLFYYDGPQVFEAMDAIGGHYIAVMIEPDPDENRYLMTGVEPERLRQFRRGMIDLRSLLIERQETEWYLAKAYKASANEFMLEPQTGALENSDFLPDAGFLLHDQLAEEITLREARERNNLVLEIAVEPPEAAAGHRIRIGTLAELLGHIQAMVKHAYSTALKDVPEAVRRAIDRKDAHLLDVVVPAATGSFLIVLEGAKTPDLLGQSELARALRCVDELFANVSDPKRALEEVRKRKGHLAGSYLRLLRFLDSKKTGLRYAWAEPNFEKPNRKTIAESEVAPLVSALSGVASLGAESVELVGTVDNVKVDSGTWRITTSEGVFSGKTKRDGPCLAGTENGGSYRFSCEEIIEEMEGTGREKRSLYLIEYQPI